MVRIVGFHVDIKTGLFHELFVALRAGERLLGGGGGPGGGAAAPTFVRTS